MEISTMKWDVGSWKWDVRRGKVEALVLVRALRGGGAQERGG